MMRVVGPRLARWALAVCCAAAVGLLLPGRVAAGFAFRVDPAATNLPAGGTATLNVYLDATDTPETTVTDFTVRLGLTGGVPGVAFLGYTDPTADPTYIFFGNSAGYAGTPGAADPGDPSPPTDFPAPAITLSDFYDFINNEPVTLPAAVGTTDTYLLGTVTIGYTGPSPGGVVGVHLDTTFTRLNNDDATYTAGYSDGSVLAAPYAPSSAVPMPPAAVAFTAGGLLLARFRRRP